MRVFLSYRVVMTDAAQRRLNHIKHVFIDIWKLSHYLWQNVVFLNMYAQLLFCVYGGGGPN